MKTHPFVFWTYHLVGVMFCLLMFSAPYIILKVLAGVAAAWHSGYDLRLK